MNTRLDLLDRLPKNSIGAELGVFRGEFSARIINRVQPSMLYLVDVFSGMHNSAGEWQDMYQMRFRLQERFKDQPNVNVVQSYSDLFLKVMAGDGKQLDWVYIDTNHDYQTTVNELAASRSAVKPGGIISGHDYDENEFPGVVKAVTEFCELWNLKPEFTGEDRLKSYWIVNG